MTDPGLQFVADVNAILGTLYTGAGACLELETKVGARQHGQFTRAPAVRWEMGKVSHEAGESANSLLEERQEYLVEVWGDDEETARELKNNLLRAARTVIGKSKLSIGIFDWIREGQTTKGSKLKGSLTSFQDVTKNSAVTMVTIKHQTHVESPDAP